MFPRPAPSLFYFPGLGTRPVYDKEEDKVIFKNYVSKLTDNFDVILKEYLAVLERNDSSSISDYTLSNDEHKLNNGDWVWNSLILKGKKQPKFQVNYPVTCEILESFSEENPKLMSGIPFSYAFFSTLKKRSKIDPHYGPCNLRIRCHFPLLIPEGDCGMEVGGKIIKWEVGVPLFFDDCYEHRGELFIYLYLNE